MPSNGTAKKKSPTKRAAAAKAKPRLTNLKIPPTELAVIRANAKRHMGGNVSAWLREAGTKYRPNTRRA